MSTVREVLAARARTTPNATFILAGEQRYSFRAVEARAEAFAAFLDNLALPAPRVATFLTHGADGILAMLGTHVAGGVFAAFNRQLRGSVLAEKLAQIKPLVLVTEAAALDALPAISSAICRTLLFTDYIPPKLQCPADVQLGLFADAVGTAPASRRCQVAYTDLASLMFTSGTTGRAKVVRIPHNYLCRGAARLAEGFKFGERDTLHAWAPLSHVSGQLYTVMTALISGARLALFPTFSAGAFWEQVCGVDATFIIGFSNVAKILLNSSAAEAQSHKLRMALLAGLSPALTKEFESRFGVRVVQAYGMTEAEPITVSRIDSVEPVGCLGRPAPDFDVAVVDELDLPLPAGSVGRIVARPRAPYVMMEGYEGDPAATVEAFRNLWFHSQDLGWLDADGYLFFAERAKHAIRRRGENISSWEIENVLRTHPAVADCVVVGVPSPLGEQDVKAIVVAVAALPTPAAAELHQFCVTALPRFMVPRYFEFLPALPTTELGKVARDGLDHLGPQVWDAEAPSN